MKRIRVPPPVIQPAKCRGCIWGKWEGAIQYCPKSICVKDGAK